MFLQKLPIEISVKDVYEHLTCPWLTPLHTQRTTFSYQVNIFQFVKFDSVPRLAQKEKSQSTDRSGRCVAIGILRQTVAKLES